MNIKTKLSSLMYPPIALALLAACSSNDVLENNNETTTQGQTLTIRATTGGEDGTRVSFDKSTYATKWEESDMLYIYAGDTKYVGVYRVTQIIDNHNAYFIGRVSLPNKPLTITGYVRNPNVKTSDGGSTTDNKNFGKYIDVDYSEQDGTWEDAMSRCVLFSKSKYDPNNPPKDYILDMKFEYKTTFFKLMLDFGDPSINTTASMCLTGDNMVSNSRINAIGTNAGKTNYVKDLFINIKDATITNGKATVYVAMYSQPLKNVYLQAVLKNGADGADGDVYDFNISNNATTAITLAPGKVYPIERKGVKQEIPATLADLKGKGTKEAPYQIGSMADLKCMANNFKSEADSKGKYFELTSDIILNGEWTPISQYGKAFRGTFNGNGHTISGDITIKNLTTNQGAGLFGVITTDGVIKNLTSKLNINATSTNDNTTNTYTGSIVGRIITAGTVENCTNKGAVKATTQFVGGIIGAIQLDGKKDLTENKKVIVEACANKGDVANNFNNAADKTISLGGIIGFLNGNSSNKEGNYKSDIEVKGCYLDGAKLAMISNKYSAGIIGLIQNPRDADQSKVTACWTKNITLPTGGNRASIVSSGSGNATDTSKSLPYTLNYCWADKKYNSGFACSVNAVINNCKIASEESLDSFYSKMNTAWGSNTYKFNSKGEIVEK